MRSSAAALALAVGVAAGGAARADDPVTIGALTPLSGASAAAGALAKAAIELGEDIVNTPHPGLEALPLGPGQGLPHRHGAKIAVVFADDQANPSVAQAQVARLIAHDKVAALIGAGPSAVALAATALAERRGVPFLVADSIAPEITRRGFKWSFRTTPTGADFAAAYGQFLGQLKAAGGKLDTVALVHESGEIGTATAAELGAAIKAAGFDLIADIAYPASSSDLSAPVTQLRDKHPDVAILVGNAADAGLLIKTMKTLDYRPPVLIGDDFGFSDPGFVAAAGNLAQGLIDRSAWSAGKPGSATAIIDGLYKTKTGRDLDDTAARILQGFLVLADAIDRAASTDPAAIQKALQEADLKPKQLVVGYRGVKFDDTGQNALAWSYLVQLQGKGYATVWPQAAATGKLDLPYKGWR